MHALIINRKRTARLVVLILAIAAAAPLSWMQHEIRQNRLNRVLIAAVKRNDPQAAAAALRLGADPNARDLPMVQDSVWRMLLDRLFHKNHKNTVASQVRFALLIAVQNDYDPGPPERLGLPDPLMILSNERRLRPLKTQIVRALLEAGADANVRDTDGSTALMRAIYDANAEAVHSLLMHGARVDLQRKDGWTALWIAVERGDLAVSTGREIVVVRDLLAHGADVDIRAEGGQTIFEFMKTMERPDPAISELLQKSHDAKQR